ncbi:hypothetical protein KSP40_PGU004493 [Platanthera guangdongensis]|uniref:EF hand associated type-2 domain-containing protein n=1 Tax=Platanthera guangdongensis TaxID=2320717 RepID=A0ABR2MZC4_9ASPA
MSRKAFSVEFCLRNYAFRHDLQVKVPIILCGCKLDLIGESESTIDNELHQMMQNFLEIETCIKCSSLRHAQVNCFTTPLQPHEIAEGVKIVHDYMASSITKNGLNLAGFIFLHTLFILKGRTEIIWMVLRKFGYDNDLKLREDLIPTIFKRATDQPRKCLINICSTNIYSINKCSLNISSPCCPFIIIFS